MEVCSMSKKNILHCALITLLFGHTCHAMSTLKRWGAAARVRSQRFYDRSKKWTAVLRGNVPNEAASQAKTLAPAGISTAYFPPQELQSYRLPTFADRQRSYFKEGLLFDRVWGSIKDIKRSGLYYITRKDSYSDKKRLEDLLNKIKPHGYSLGELIHSSDIPSKIINLPLLDGGKTLLQASIEKGVIWNNILALLRAGADAHREVPYEDHPITLALNHKKIDLVIVLMLVNPDLQTPALVTNLPKPVQANLMQRLNLIQDDYNQQKKAIQEQLKESAPQHMRYIDILTHLQLIKEIKSALLRRERIARENKQNAGLTLHNRWRNEDL